MAQFVVSDNDERDRLDDLRCTALHNAVKATEGDGSKIITPDDILTYARKFEKYLCGEE